MTSETVLSKKEIRALRKEKIKSLIEQKKTAVKKTGGVLLIIAITIFGIQAIAKEMKSNKNQATALANIVTHKDWVRGTENPAIDLIIYSNFACDECAKAYKVVKQAESEFQDKIKITYRHFFNQKESENSNKLAEFSEAAGFQSKFWETHDLIFDSAEEFKIVNNSDASMALYTQKLNLNLEDVKNDMYSSAIKSKIQRDLESAEVASVRTAPTIFINNTKIENPQSYEELKSAIEKLLEKKVE